MRKAEFVRFDHQLKKIQVSSIDIDMLLQHFTLDWRELGQDYCAMNSNAAPVPSLLGLGSESFDATQQTNNRLGLLRSKTMVFPDEFGPRRNFVLCGGFHCYADLLGAMAVSTPHLQRSTSPATQTSTLAKALVPLHCDQIRSGSTHKVVHIGHLQCITTKTPRVLRLLPTNCVFEHNLPRLSGAHSDTLFCMADFPRAEMRSTSHPIPTITSVYGF
jgi:hypothetical protein